MRGVLLLLSIASFGCGAKVVFGTGGGDAAGGSGGGTTSAECVLPCGAECTKCEGDSCFTGWCSETGTCMTPDLPATCPGE